MNPINSVGRLSSINSDSTVESASSGSRVKKAVNKLESSINHTRQLHKDSQLTHYDSNKKIISRNLESIDNNDFSIYPDMLRKSTQPTILPIINSEPERRDQVPNIPTSDKLRKAIKSKPHNPQGYKPTQHDVLTASHAPVMDELKEVLKRKGKTPPIVISDELHETIKSKPHNPQGPKPTQHDVLTASHAPVMDELKSVLEKRKKVN